MPKNNDVLSELERELELDMADVSEPEIDESGEAGDAESDDMKVMDDAEFDFEDSRSDEFEGNYAERLYELAQREFESPDEATEAFDGVLNEMYENFLGLDRVKNYLKKKGRSLIQAGLRTGVGILKKHPAFGLIKNVLAGKNLTQILSSLAQTAAAGTPIGAAVLPALKSLGFPGQSQEEQREAWNNFVDVAREAYLNLASNLNEAADQPFQAAKVASDALTRGLQRAVQQRRNGGGRPEWGRRGGDKTFRIRVRPGQRVRLVILGR